MSYRIESGFKTYIRRPKREKPDAPVYNTETILMVYRKPPEVVVQDVRMEEVATGAISLTRRADGIHIEFNPQIITIDGRVHDRRFKKRTVVVPRGERVTVTPRRDRDFLYYPDGGNVLPQRLQHMIIVNKRAYRAEGYIAI